MLEMLLERLEIIEEKISVARLNGHEDLVDYYQSLQEETKKRISQII